MQAENMRPTQVEAPLLLVDVDGVLNAVVAPPFATLKAGGTSSGVFEAEFTARNFPIRVPVGTREQIAELQSLFECVWATTWEDNAAEHLSPVLGFGADWPVIRFHDDFPDAGTWKLPAVQRFAELPENQSRALAWIDDDLQPDALEWTAHRTRAGVHTLMVRPEANVGFTSRHFQRLLAFHADHQRAAAQVSPLPHP